MFAAIIQLTVYLFVAMVQLFILSIRAIGSPEHPVAIRVLALFIVSIPIILLIAAGVHIEAEHQETIRYNKLYYEELKRKKLKREIAKDKIITEPVDAAKVEAKPKSKKTTSQTQSSAVYRFKVYPVNLYSKTFRVRIMNITEKYKYGMSLPEGQYKLELSCDICETSYVWVEHSSDSTKKVRVTKLKKQ